MTLSQRLHAERAAKRAKPPKPRQVRNPQYDLGMFWTTLGRANSTQTDERDLAELTVGPLAQLERLRTGQLDATGFVELAEACSAAAELADQLHRHGTTSTQELMDAALPEILLAAGALDGLACRNTSTGHWVAKADELHVLRSIVGPGGWYEQLISVADRGAVCRALQKAAQSIDGAVRR